MAWLKKAPKKTPNEREDKKALPQLSDVSRGQGFHFQQTRDGLFVPLDVMNDPGEGEKTPLEKLTYLDLVLKSLPGKTDNRESIPDVMSQYLAYRITLNADPMGAENRDIIAAWRGALALAILYPYFGGLTWRGVDESRANDFLQSIGAVVNMRPKGGFQALCCEKEGLFFPVAGYDDTVHAVPAAADDGLRMAQVPFKKEQDGRLVFTDPVPTLGSTMLKKLKEGLNALPFSRTAHTAKDAFIADIEERLSQTGQDQAEKTLVNGLLLSDVSQVSLYVAHKATVPGPCLNSLDEVAHGIYEKTDYRVMLQGSQVAFLDAESLLFLPDPLGLAAGEDYKALARDNAQLLTQPNLAALLEMKRYRLQKDFPNSLLLGSGGSLPDAKVAAAFCPKRRMTDQAVLQPPFTWLDTVLAIDEDPTEWFCQTVLCLSDSLRPAPSVREALFGARRFYEGGMAPFGVYGAKAYALLGYQGMAPAWELNADEEKVLLSLRFDPYPKEMPLSYRVEKSLAPMDLKPVTDQWRPGVAVFADMEEAGAKQSGKITRFLVHTAFKPFEEGNYLSTLVYGRKGEPALMAHTLNRDDKEEALWQHWQNAFISDMPEFILAQHKGASFGAVMNTPQSYRIEAGEADQYDLAVDFGMTGSIGAYVKHTGGRPTLKEIAYPLLPEGALGVMSDEAYALKSCAKRFIAPSLLSRRTADGNEVVLTSVKRFASAVEQGGSEPGLDGVIHHPGDDPLRKELYGDVIHTGFKLMADSRGDLTASSDVKLFLKQLVQMYLWCLKREGAKRVSVRYASPLALNDKARAEMKRLFYEITEEAAVGMGFDSVSVMVTNESMAVGAYFAHLPDPEILIRPKQGILALDIGGGTADYAFFIQTEQDGESAVTVKHCASNTLAGHRVIAGYLYELRQAAQPLNWFGEALLRTAAGDNDPTVRNIAKGILLGECDTFETLSATMDILLRRNLPAFKEVLYLDTKSSRQYLSRVTFELTLLFFVAWLIYVKESRARVKETTLCLAGNGALLYHDLMDDKRKGLILAVASGDMENKRFRVTPRLKHFKCEVVKGLLADDMIYEGGAGEPPLAMGEKDSSDALWRAFEAFLRRYGEAIYAAFPKDELAARINDMVQNRPQTLKQLETMFKDRVDNTDSLNEHILYIRDLVVGD